MKWLLISVRFQNTRRALFKVGAFIVHFIKCYFYIVSEPLPFSVGGPPLGDESIESAFGLGELAGLTVANEADPLAFEVGRCGW